MEEDADLAKTLKALASDSYETPGGGETHPSHGSFGLAKGDPTTDEKDEHQEPRHR